MAKYRAPVRRLGMLGMVVVMAATAVACGGGGGGDSGGDDINGPTATTAAVSTAPVATTAPGPTVPSTNFTLRITEVRLVNSEESDSGMRMLLPAGVASAAVTLTGLPTPNQVI